jgi:hypothetical protein
MVLVSSSIQYHQILFIRAPQIFFNLSELDRLGNGSVFLDPVSVPMANAFDMAEGAPVPTASWLSKLIGWIRGRRVEDSPV